MFTTVAGWSPDKDGAMRRSRLVRGAAVLAAALVLAGCVTNQAAPPGNAARDAATLAIGVDLPFLGSGSGRYQ